MRHIYYMALNGTRKIANISRMEFRVGSGPFKVYVSRHCGGLLAIRETISGGVEITEEALRERLKQAGVELPWERKEA